MSKILLIDDDLDYRDVVSEVLLGAGFEVATAADGQEALKYIQEKNRVDLILLDLFMPNMDGLTFYYHLTNDLKKDIPVIVLTNLTETAYPRGIKDFIVKSDANLDDLVAKVKTHLPPANQQ